MSACGCSTDPLLGRYPSLEPRGSGLSGMGRLREIDGTDARSDDDGPDSALADPKVGGVEVTEGEVVPR